MTDSLALFLWRYLALLLVVLWPSLVLADGGTIRASRKLGKLQVTVFTAPTPLRAGLVDVSVFVQDAETGQARAEIPVTVRATCSADPFKELAGPATAEAATNKLFRAIQLDLEVPGRWTLAIEVAAPGGSEKIDIEVEVGEPIPSWVNLALWIGWPGLALVLFAIHQWLAWRRNYRRGILSPELVSDASEKRRGLDASPMRR